MLNAILLSSSENIDSPAVNIVFIERLEPDDFESIALLFERYFFHHRAK